MFAGVGERTREGNDLYREMVESGVIKLGDQQVCHILASFGWACPLCLMNISSLFIVIHCVIG